MFWSNGDSAEAFQQHGNRNHAAVDLWTGRFERGPERNGGIHTLKLDENGILSGVALLFVIADGKLPGIAFSGNELRVFDQVLLDKVRDFFAQQIYASAA